MLEGRNRFGFGLALSLIMLLPGARGYAEEAATKAEPTTAAASESTAASQNQDAATPRKHSRHSYARSKAEARMESAGADNPAASDEVPVIFGDNEGEGYKANKQPSPEETAKADELHKKALALLDKNDLQEALKVEREAIQAAPTYWLPRASAAVILFKLGDRMQALSAASWSVRCKKEPVAQRNFARLLEAMNWTSLAQKQYERSLTGEPNSIDAKLGLISCYVMSKDLEKAKALLKEVRDTQPQNFETVYLLGLYDLQAGQTSEAKSELEKALTLKPGKDEAMKINSSLFHIALKDGDLATAQKLLPSLPPETANKQQGNLLDAQLKAAGSPQATAEIINPLKAEKTTAADLLYKMGQNIFDKSQTATDSKLKGEYLQQAADLFLLADQKEVNKVSYKLALAGIYDAQGKPQNSLQQLSAIVPLAVVADPSAQPTTPPVRTDALTRKLAGKGELLGDAFTAQSSGGTETYKSHLRLAQFNMPKPKCKCHQKSSERAILNVPGVLWATNKDNGENATFSVAYDERKTSQDKLTKLKAIENLQEKLEPLSDDSLPTIAGLVQTIQKGEASAPKLANNIDFIQLTMPALAMTSDKVAAEKSTAQ